jgi:DNA repair protein RadA/Sms
MAKPKKIYRCTQCGGQAVKWQGKCPHCGQWNTLEEQTTASTGQAGAPAGWGRAVAKAVTLESIRADEAARQHSFDTELDRVLGGGIVPGSLVLLGGEPGIGKSTLMLQLCLRFAEHCLYVTGEESAAQIRLRQIRMGEAGPNCYILAASGAQAVAQALEEVQPRLVVLDSIQTWYSDEVEGVPGNLNQIRHGATWLMNWAKGHGVPVFLIGHITKEGAMAGPKVLEHMVDTVLYFEGDFHHQHRILRSVKNRFGPSAEIGLYTMAQNGLQPVANPSEVLQSDHNQALSGIALAPVLEGLRPLLIEVQALMSRAFFGTPQRTPTGFDLKRMSMLLAVLEKRCGLAVSNQDVFVNVVGGLRLADPGADLAVLAAMASSFSDQPLPPRSCFCGEVGLSGEIRPVAQIQRRVQEAVRLGMERVYIGRAAAEDLSAGELAPYARGAETVPDLLQSLGWG